MVVSVGTGQERRAKPCTGTKYQKLCRVLWYKDIMDAGKDKWMALSNLSLQISRGLQYHTQQLLHL